MFLYDYDLQYKNTSDLLKCLSRINLLRTLNKSKSTLLLYENLSEELDVSIIFVKDYFFSQN